MLSAKYFVLKLVFSGKVGIIKYKSHITCNKEEKGRSLSTKKQHHDYHCAKYEKLYWKLDRLLSCVEKVAFKNIVKYLS